MDKSSIIYIFQANHSHIKVKNWLKMTDTNKFVQMADTTKKKTFANTQLLILFYLFN